MGHYDDGDLGDDLARMRGEPPKERVVPGGFRGGLNQQRKEWYERQLDNHRVRRAPQFTYREVWFLMGFACVVGCVITRQIPWWVIFLYQAAVMVFLQWEARR